VGGVNEICQTRVGYRGDILWRQ